MLHFNSFFLFIVVVLHCNLFYSSISSSSCCYHWWARLCWEACWSGYCISCFFLLQFLTILLILLQMCRWISAEAAAVKRSSYQSFDRFSTGYDWLESYRECRSSTKSTQVRSPFGTEGLFHPPLWLASAGRFKSFLPSHAIQQRDRFIVEFPQRHT